jgi:pimeloyl-ACP methyl ester carboxylesterase
VPLQKELLARPDVAATEDLDFDNFGAAFTGSYGTTFLDSGDHETARIAQTHQVFHDHGSRVMAQTLRYLKERKENFDAWSRMLFTYPVAPMTVIWGAEDPVAVIAMADRIKKNRPVTDLYKMEGTSHWPMIEDPEFIGDAIIARIDSV